MSTTDDVKRIDIREFRELGILQELNRRFLHPLGLALEVRVSEDGSEELGGVWDYRDDPEGILYAELDLADKAARFEELERRAHGSREAALGFVIQPLEDALSRRITSGRSKK